MKRQLTKTAIIIAVIICILLGVLFFLAKDISQRADEIARLRGEIELISQTGEMLSVFHSDINLVKPYLGKIDKILPSKDQLIKFSSDVKPIAASSSVNFYPEFSGEGADPSGLKWIGLTISSDGSFANLINFLNVLENGQYLINFNSLDFVNKDNKFKLLMAGKLFYFDK